jgi:signal transduction histidine kinase
MEVKYRRKLDRLTEGGEPDTGSENAAEVAEIREALEKPRTIASKADTIQVLISELLHSNLEDSEKAEVHPEEAYATVIEEYLMGLRTYGKIVPENHIPKCLVYMDRQRMEQVIDNIVGNSVKYAGTEIRVLFDEVSDMLMPDGTTGSFIRITIKDAGPGVSEDDLPLIAQKYYRGSNASEKSGYGMGLYLVKQYMQKQGGDMEYYNDNGFTVVLMLKKV